MELFAVTDTGKADEWIGTLHLTDGQNTGWSFCHNLARQPYLQQWIKDDDHIVAFRFRLIRNEEKESSSMQITAYLLKAVNAEDAAAQIASAPDPVQLRAFQWQITVEDWIRYFVDMEALVTRPGFPLANRPFEISQWLDRDEIMEEQNEERLRRRGRPG